MWVLRRREGAGLAAYALEQGAWRPIERSKSFPCLRIADLNPFIARIGVDDDTSILGDFASWLQSTRVPTINP
jgi:hypothetical protein